MPRNPLTSESAEYCFARLRDGLERRLKEKGTRSLTSTHEAMGVVDEEVIEMKAAVIANDQDAFENEMVDIAVGCMVAIMSRYVKGLDW